MEVCLIIDTALNTSTVGLVDVKRQKLMWQHLLAEPSGSSSVLENVLDSGFKQCQIHYHQLKALAVSVGPGSFTGIKIGLAFSYGVKRALPHLLMAGISSLKAAATAVKNSFSIESLLLVFPATKTHAYSVYSGRDGQCSLLPISLVNYRAEWQQVYPDIFSEELMIVSPLSEFRQYIHHEHIEFKAITSEQLNEFALQGMAHQVFTLWQDGFGHDLPQPLYLRKSAPEERLTLSNRGIII